MPALKHPLPAVLAIMALCLVLQLGFAFGLFGPAWLSPLLSLPALALITWLWRRAARANQSARAFTELVI